MITRTLTLGETDEPCMYIRVPVNFTVKINGVDYFTVSELEPEGITVQAWHEATLGGIGPEIFIPMDSIETIHIY